MTSRTLLPLLILTGAAVAAADLPTLPTLSGEFHIRYRRVRRSYPKPVPRAGLAKAPYKEEENVVKDLYVASWGTTVRTKDASTGVIDPLLKTGGRRPNSRVENRPDRLVMWGGDAVVVDEESHGERVAFDLPLLGVNTPYARALSEPPESELWKQVDGKDDPATRCGMPMSKIAPDMAYTYWPGHYKVDGGRLLETSILTPDNPDILRRFEDYSSFEGTPIARRVVFTLFANGSTGTRDQRPIATETIQTVELIERGVGSLPTWQSEVRPLSPVIHRKGGKVLEESVFGDGKVKILDGAPAMEKDDRMMRTAFGAAISGIVATGLVGAFLRTRR